MLNRGSKSPKSRAAISLMMRPSSTTTAATNTAIHRSSRSASAMQMHQQVKAQLQPANHVMYGTPAQQLVLELARGQGAETLDSVLYGEGVEADVDCEIVGCGLGISLGGGGDVGAGGGVASVELLLRLCGSSMAAVLLGVAVDNKSAPRGLLYK